MHFALCAHAVMHIVRTHYSQRCKCFECEARLLVPLCVSNSAKKAIQSDDAIQKLVNHYLCAILPLATTSQKIKLSRCHATHGDFHHT